MNDNVTIYCFVSLNAAETLLIAAVSRQSINILTLCSLWLCGEHRFGFLINNVCGCLRVSAAKDFAFCPTPLYTHNRITILDIVSVIV